MADQGGQQQTNGAAPAAAEILDRPNNVGLAQARIRQSRAATLAALETADLGDDAGAAKALKPAPKAEAKATPPAPKSEPTLDDDAASLASADDGDDDEGAGGERKSEAKPDAKPDAKADPEEGKRLASIQKAELESRKRIQKERADLAAEREQYARDRAAFDAERAEVASLKKARERAALDPMAYLEAAGITDFEYVSKQAFLRAKGAADPNNREAAARLIREREHGSELAQLKSKYEQLEATLRVCPHCGHHFPLGAPERVAQLVDPGTWREVAEDIRPVDPLDFFG